MCNGFVKLHNDLNHTRNVTCEWLNHTFCCHEYPSGIQNLSSCIYSNITEACKYIWAYLNDFDPAWIGENIVHKNKKGNSNKCSDNKQGQNVEEATIWALSPGVDSEEEEVHKLPDIRQGLQERLGPSSLSAYRTYCSDADSTDHMTLHRQTL